MLKTRLKYILIFIIILLLIPLAVVIYQLLGIYQENIRNATVYTINYDYTEGGTVHGELTQKVNYKKDGTTVTAVPDNGFKFVEWSDGYKIPYRTDRIIKTNMAVTAIFAEERLNLKYQCDENAGYIEGEANQVIKYGESGETVTAVPNEGYVFAGWSDGLTEATRSDCSVNNNLTVSAKFTRINFTVKFECGEQKYGHIVYLTPPIEDVAYGENSSKVIAEPKSGYKFLGWSDGTTDPVKQIENVKQDYYLTAHFGYSIEYCAESGGTIIGETFQQRVPGEEYNSVTAVPDEGYVFAGWSDLLNEPERKDEAESICKITAHFVPVEKTFTYNYGMGSPKFGEITLTQEELDNFEFEVPEMVDYNFCGWYADEGYELKVADENGRLMLGSFIFSLDTGNLYAKWEKTDEEKPLTYKLLIIGIEEFHAILEAGYPKNGPLESKAFDSKMSYIELKYVALVRKLMSDYLNEWFNGKLKFEVDLYFTLSPLTSENFSVYEEPDGHIDYSTYAYKIPEVQSFYKNYHGVINIYAYQSFENVSSLGTTTRVKYACENIDFILKVLDTKTLDELYYEILDGSNQAKREMFIDTFMIDFVFINELYYVAGRYNEPGYGFGEYSFIDCLAYYMQFGGYVQLCKSFLLNDGVINGCKIGLPSYFWEEIIFENLSMIFE